MSTSHKVIDASKKPALQDWHPADIVAAVWKKNTSLQREARLRGYHNNSLHLVLRRPWPKAERIVSDIIGVPPQQIWPSRYNKDGTPKSGRGQRIAACVTKDSTGNNLVNVHEQRAA
jgi:Ner family transcriptional regulator